MFGWSFVSFFLSAYRWSEAALSMIGPPGCLLPELLYWASGRGPKSYVFGAHHGMQRHKFNDCTYASRRQPWASQLESREIPDSTTKPLSWETRRDFFVFILVSFLEKLIELKLSNFKPTEKSNAKNTIHIFLHIFFYNFSM